MQWPLFLGYAAVIWLIFVKLHLVRLIPTIASSNSAPRFAAILKLDDPSLQLPAGAREEGAVYTDKVAFAAMFRKGLLRTQTIVNYLAWGMTTNSERTRPAALSATRPRIQIDHMRERREGLAAGKMIFAGQPPEAVGIGFEFDMRRALAFRERLLAGPAGRRIVTTAAALPSFVEKHSSSPLSGISWTIASDNGRHAGNLSSAARNTALRASAQHRT